MTYSKFYDHIYALALRLNKSEIETKIITLRAFKAGVRHPGLRSHLVKEKPKDIAAVHKCISEWEAMVRAAQPLDAPRVQTSTPRGMNTQNTLTFLTPEVNTISEPTYTSTPIDPTRALSQQISEAHESMRKQQEQLEISRQEIQELREQLHSRVTLNENRESNRQQWRNDDRSTRQRNPNAGYRNNNRNYRDRYRDYRDNYRDRED